MFYSTLRLLHSLHDAAVITVKYDRAGHQCPWDGQVVMKRIMPTTRSFVALDNEEH